MGSLSVQRPENLLDSGEGQVEVGGMIPMSIFYENCIVMFMDECSSLRDGLCFNSNQFEWIVNQESLSMCKKLNLVRLT